MNELKKLLESEKLIIGKERTMKLLKKGELQKVFIAKNLDEETKEDITRYAELNKTELEVLKINNDELGTFCRKPFSIAVIGLQK
ncbi:ribosomal L7Ae/L30e/S12e/Gadd45 family protein [Candidatus Woesearchaeota archaeon]|nr:ribosomal L7Ae/L30e/S12e/Gadd45 family protein [Candidatus Woesearchaeota archaeon]